MNGLYFRLPGNRKHQKHRVDDGKTKRARNPPESDHQAKGLCERAKIDALVRRHVRRALVHPEVFRCPGNRGVRVLEPDREQPRVEPYLVKYGITSQLFGGVLEVRIAALVSKLADIASHTC